MVEIKSGYKINDDLTIEDDGFKLELTPEEMERLKRKANLEGKTVEQMIAQMAIKANEEAADEMIKRLEEYQHRKR